MPDPPIPVTPELTRRVESRPAFGSGAPVLPAPAPAPQESTRAEAAALVRRARAGEPEAFEALVREYETVVLRVARSLVGNLADAEDVAQEAFLRLYRRLDRLDPERDPIGWIYRLTVHSAWDCLARRRRDRRLEEDLQRQPAPGMRGTGELAEAAEIREILRQSLQILPPKVRAVFILKEVEGLEVVEVARVLSITRITVRRHLMRARRSLGEHLRGSHPELLDF